MFHWQLIKIIYSLTIFSLKSAIFFFSEEILTCVEKKTCGQVSSKKALKFFFNKYKFVKLFLTCVFRFFTEFTFKF
ncbi:hypothetical protein Mgra_00009452 [Meloidogyne graminicola]|uniref:Uncharacterized protein n=1 Tax=Meloidogyne graminicola TaxID=189291 RepID=A0A8S9ZC59_9BILA|nr:hypothetical protein Mgra_00009452 [Meloidogyne graminicola]